jgi:hypothetical protein
MNVEIIALSIIYLPSAARMIGISESLCRSVPFALNVEVMFC